MRLEPALVCLMSLSLVAGGCRHDPAVHSGPAPAATPPAEPATAGAPAVAPIGSVVTVGHAPEGVVVGTSGIAAVAVRNPDGIALVDAATGAVRGTVPTAGAARHLGLAGPDGPVLVPLESANALAEIDLSTGRVVVTVPGVGRQPHDAARTADGTVVVTNEHGGGVLFVRDAAVAASVPGPVQPGGVAALRDRAVVADVQGNGAWVYDAPTHQLAAHGPVGVKLTHVVALTDDLAAFADTDGGTVLLERVDPQLSHVATIPAPGKPYGLACDALRHRLYITLTASNQLRIVDIADAANPHVLADLPTVQQPYSVAVDPRSGAVLVTGSTPGDAGRLQIIAAGLLPKG